MTGGAASVEAAGGRRVRRRVGASAALYVAGDVRPASL